MAKRLVICCDGTWNVPDRLDRGRISPSNVAKLALAVLPEAPDGTQQRVFYGAGVGTGMWERVRGGAFGWGLSQHVQDAYRFIVQQYDPGDQIFLFGFSRGAFTARSTAGLIRNSGILRREHADKVGAAYALYRRRDDASHPRANEAQLFRKSFAHETPITFVGVWDTVGALGIPTGIPWLPATWLEVINRRWAFHDVRLSRHVENAYHAVAIDERRAQFVPTLWEQQPDAVGQRMEQVWFAGVHTNVGGGYEDSGLSDITFHWMKEKAEGCGLAFDQTYVAANTKLDVLGELRNSKIGLYRLLPGTVRAIGAHAHGNESVHQSAVDRQQRATRPEYRPPNLRRYLDQVGARIAPWAMTARAPAAVVDQAAEHGAG